MSTFTLKHSNKHVTATSGKQLRLNAFFLKNGSGYGIVATHGMTTHYGDTWGYFRFRVIEFRGAFQGFSRRGTVAGQLKQTFYYPNSRITPSSGVDEAATNRLVKYSNDAREQRADSMLRQILSGQKGHPWH